MSHNADMNFESNDPPAWLRNMWEYGSKIAALALLLVAGFAWVAVGRWTSQLGRSLEVTVAAVDTAGDTLDVVSRTLEILDGTAAQLAVSVDRAGDTLASVADVADDTAVLLAEDLPEDLDAIRRSLDGLIDTANVVDGVLGALSFVGLDYDPAVPLDEALIELDSRIAALPSRLRSQADSLTDVSDGMADFAADADLIADDLIELQAAVAESRSIVTVYRATADEGLASLEETTNELRAVTPLVRIALVVLTASGLLMLSAVWWLSRVAGRSTPHTE